MDSELEVIIIPTPAMNVGVLDLEEKHISRGWTFQERLTSVATLHYTNEGMMWECANGIRRGTLSKSTQF
jgi:hypothetical protein